MKIKKRIRIILIIVGVIILAFIGYRVWRHMNDKYAIVEYALEGTNYDIYKIFSKDEYICYHIVGNDSFEKVLERFEEFMRMRPESELNEKMIQIFFSDSISLAPSLIVYNYLPNTLKEVSEQLGAWYCSASERHDRLDSAYVMDDFEANQICNLSANTDNNIIYLKIWDDKADGAYLAKVFPNVHYILVNYDEFNEEKVLESNKAIADFMAINDTCVFCNYSRKGEKWICPAE